MPKSKSRKKKGGSSGGGSRGGAMSGLRSSTKRIAGTGGAKKKRPRSFWDMLFWIAAGGAVLYLLLQRFG